MTAPGAPDPQEAADVLAEHLLGVTSAATGPVTEAIQQAVEAVVASLVAQWVITFGAIDALPADTVAAGTFVEYARDLIGELELPPRAQAALEEAVEAAYVLGVEHAEQFTPEGAQPVQERTPRPLPDLARVLDDQRAQALRALDERAVADTGFPAVVQAAGKVARTGPRIENNVAYETTRAAGDGVRDSTPPGWLVVWVAERDACLVCLAYAGQTTPPGIAFPEGLTFGDRPQRGPEPLMSPPKHPNCRCVLQPLHPDDTDIPANLQREARRSVLRGWADDDSVPAKLRAADRLLARGADLPKSVEERARRAVREQRFS